MYAKQRWFYHKDKSRHLAHLLAETSNHKLTIKMKKKSDCTWAINPVEKVDVYKSC